jgi:hypothetical protein
VPLLSFDYVGSVNHVGVFGLQGLSFYIVVGVVAKFDHVHPLHFRAHLHRCAHLHTERIVVVFFILRSSTEKIAQSSLPRGDV